MQLNQSKAFVQTAILNKNQLSNQINNLFTDECYHFLRWPHDVSGVQSGKPNLENNFAPEGQIFDSKTELRWKKQKDKYQVLLLSKLEKNLDGFSAITGNWTTEDHNAVIYPRTETRLPKPVKVPENIKFRQRYFYNFDTSTIHFIALTV